MSIFVSIIVPVYKVEATIHRCIDSILCMKFSDFELILVDDGSPDCCGNICDCYAQSDSRIKVIHQKNQGLAAARNSGIENARGCYILFCDSDDKYDSEELSAFLFELQREADEDTLYCFNFKNIWPNEVEAGIRYPKADIQFNMIDDKIVFLSSKCSHDTMGFAVWDKLYSKKIIDDYHIRVLERDKMENKDDWAEDLTFNLQYSLCIKNIKVMENPIYLLTKHGLPEEQNENGLVGRIDHMLNIMSFLTQTVAYKQEKVYYDNFWKVAIWHMRRYFYLEANAKGIEILRKEYLESPKYEMCKDWIICALKNWEQFGKRWDLLDSKDYRNLLEYLVTGNLLKYRVKSYYLWNIYFRLLRKHR